MSERFGAADIFVFNEFWSCADFISKRTTLSCVGGGYLFPAIGDFTRVLFGETCWDKRVGECMVSLIFSFIAESDINTETCIYN